LEPPPPRAPPVTNALHSSVVPAWSEFMIALVFGSSTGLTFKALYSLKFAPGL
jgi:hypothetical protein